MTAEIWSVLALSEGFNFSIDCKNEMQIDNTSALKTSES